MNVSDISDEEWAARTKEAIRLKREEDMLRFDDYGDRDKDAISMMKAYNIYPMDMALLIMYIKTSSYLQKEDLALHDYLVMSKVLLNETEEDYNEKCSMNLYGLTNVELASGAVETDFSKKMSASNAIDKRGHISTESTIDGHPGFIEGERYIIERDNGI